MVDVSRPYTRAEQDAISYKDRYMRNVNAIDKESSKILPILKQTLINNKKNREPILQDAMLFQFGMYKFAIGMLKLETDINKEDLDGLKKCDDLIETYMSKILQNPEFDQLMKNKDAQEATFRKWRGI